MWQIRMWQAPLRGDLRSRGTEAPPTFGRNGIVPAAAPRIATGQTTHAEPAPTKQSMRFERFQKVGGTSRLETASAARSRQKREHGRDERLVTANEKTRAKEHQG